VSLIRTSSLALVAAVAAICLALAAGTASASTSGAHFTATSTSVNSLGALVATFSEAGLGNENVDYTLSANATATYACINGGGNHPKAANKENVNATVSGGADIQAKNGHASGSITAGPPASTLVCPGGQTFVLACVSYTGIVLTDTTNGVTTPLADAQRTFFNIGSPC
jgi:outer membrane usher protein FimD/PapC